MGTFIYDRAGNSEAQQREAFSRLFTQVGVLAAPGVLGGLVVSQNTTADGNVLVASGSCVLHPTMTAGASLIMNDSTLTLNVLGPNPVGGLPRNDIVVADSITSSIVVIVGTPNATPTDPSVPNTAIALARLRHAASAATIPTAKIDQLTVATALRGTPIPVASQGARDALAATDGLRVYRLDTHTIETFNGTRWQVATSQGLVPYTAAGSYVVVPNGGGMVTINFPVTFAAAPVVVVCNGSSPVMVVYVGTTTTSAVTFFLFDMAGNPLTSGSRRVNWTATGTLA